MNAAIYPGSFDPLTNGHLDIIQRAAKTFGRLIVAISNNQQKNHTFDIDQRLELVRKSIAGISGVEVDTFEGLLVEYARKKKISTLIRGLRAFSDFEYEFHLATMNHQLARDVETVFIMTCEKSFYLSSRLVREVASLGGDVKEMVPAHINTALKTHFKK